MIKRVDIPATRDPFINAQVVPAGIDEKTGEERFWSTTWNSNSGCIGALFSQSGKNKIFRFDKKKGQFGFYGASYQGDDIMWLSGFLDNVTKLNLKTGKTSSFDTGLPHALSMSGFVYDDATKKIFSCAYNQGDKKRKGFVFDTVKCTTIKKFEDIPLKNNQLRYSLKNNDGTYTFINIVPDVELMIWDPKTDRLDVVTDALPSHPNANYSKLVKNREGNIYIPSYGWFSPKKRRFVDGKIAKKEACWFGMKENTIYGVKWSQSTGSCTVVKWDLEKNTIDDVANVPDAMTYHFELTDDNKIIVLNMYGYFYRINPENGGMETSKQLDSNAIGHIDCIHRINEDRLLATPFITQRFFEIDINKNKGYDLGRATGGCGEVLAVIPFKDKIYMASYTKGYMTEYDPSMPARFPENPRSVVEPPNPAMRPVGYCTDEKSIYYSCSHEYGHLGSMTVKYTPGEGKSVFSDAPLENHMIRSMQYDKKTNTIIAGTTFEADCRSCPAKDDNSYIVKINPDTLKIEDKVYSPVNAVTTNVMGVLHDGKYLIGLNVIGGAVQYVSMDAKEFKPTEYNPGCQFEGTVHYTGKPGLFVIARKGTLKLWHSKNKKVIKDIHKAKGYYKLHIQDENIYLIYNDYIEIIENCSFNC